MSENNNPKVQIETTLGNITVELFQQKAPLSTKNFLDYVNQGYYNGLVFHRVISNFMIQGGGMDENMHPRKTNPPIKNEADNGLKNNRGTLAMARTNVIDSATSQFFINVKDNGFLNHRAKTPDAYGYAVFGQVVQGMEVVDQIKDVDTGSKAGHDDVPLTPIVIQSIKVIH